MDIVSFVHMEDGTKEDYELIQRLEEQSASGLVDRILEELRKLQGPMSGFQIDRLQHSLQTATRAFRDDAEDELVMAALLHDLGDGLAPYNHSEYAAAILRPYVSNRTYWIVKHHGLFQTYYYGHHLGMNRNERDRFLGSRYYQAAVDFCHNWDQNSFDPAYDTMALEDFEPILRKVFGRKPFQFDRRVPSQGARALSTDGL